jgi:predicted ATPase
VATLVDGLRPKQVLLVLDNCEHLDACAHLTDALLRGCPGLTMLATSARRWGSLARWRGTCGPPSPTPSTTPLEVLTQYDAVRRSSTAPWRCSPLRCPIRMRAVAEICRRLDGIPLALELAASCTRWRLGYCSGGWRIASGS